MRTFPQVSFLPGLSQAQRTENERVKDRSHPSMGLCGAQTSCHSPLMRPSPTALKWVVRAGTSRLEAGQAAEGGGRVGEHPEGRSPARSPTPHGGPRPPLRTLDNEVRRTRSPQRIPLLAAAAALGGLARYRGLCPSATHPDQFRPPAAPTAQARTRRLFRETHARGCYVITGRQRRWVPERLSECSFCGHAGLGQIRAD